VSEFLLVRLAAIIEAGHVSEHVGSERDNAENVQRHEGTR